MLTTAPPLITDDGALHEDDVTVHEDNGSIPKDGGAVHEDDGAIQHNILKFMEFMTGGGLLQGAGRNRVRKSRIHWARSFKLEDDFVGPWEELSGDGLDPPPLNRGALVLSHEGPFTPDSPGRAVCSQGRWGLLGKRQRGLGGLGGGQGGLLVVVGLAM